MRSSYELADQLAETITHDIVAEQAPTMTPEQRIAFKRRLLMAINGMANIVAKRVRELSHDAA